MNVSSPQKTPLYEAHLRQKAHIVHFHNWLMPVYYERILKEYDAVRRGGVGVFDVSHMGEVIVKGKEAQAFLQRLLTVDVEAMQEGSIRYGLMLNEQGGIVDDLTVYCLNAARDEFQLCVNCAYPPANIAHIMAWAKKMESSELSVKDISSQVGLLAVQGANAPIIMEQILGKWVRDLRYYMCQRCDFMGEDALVSRIGYTGEDGYEWAVPAALTQKAWDALLALGAVPCGLGARDILRLEMGFHLYGNDMDITANPISAKLAWTLRKSGAYIGYEAVSAIKKEGVARKLTPLLSTDKCNPRAGDKLYFSEADAINESHSLGHLSSGCPSPLLGKGIAFSYLPTNISSDATLYLKSGKRVFTMHPKQLPFIPRPEKPFLPL